MLAAPRVIYDLSRAAVERLGSFPADRDMDVNTDMDMDMDMDVDVCSCMRLSSILHPPAHIIQLPSSSL